MKRSSLENLVRVGQLKAESPSRAEVEGLLCSGRRRLQDAENDTLNLESRFDLAYNAAKCLLYRDFRTSLSRR